METIMHDDLLASLIALGNAEAMETLYIRHRSVCHRLAMRFVSDPYQAEEIVQDVFLKFWAKPTCYTPGGSTFRTWLCTLVRNRSIDNLRREKTDLHSQVAPVYWADGSTATGVEIISDTSSGPYEIAWSNEKGKAVYHALNRLTPRQREAITLVYFRGMSQKQIAEKLGVPIGTVKTRTHSGLLRLRTLLMQQGLVGSDI